MLFHMFGAHFRHGFLDGIGADLAFTLGPGKAPKWLPNRSHVECTLETDVENCSALARMLRLLPPGLSHARRGLRRPVADTGPLNL